MEPWASDNLIKVAKLSNYVILYSLIFYSINTFIIKTFSDTIYMYLIYIIRCYCDRYKLFGTNTHALT